jgi:hypothetical protein
MNKCFILLCIFITMNYKVDGAMKKSWKPQVKFDAEASKFTPFDEEDAGGRPIEHHYQPHYEALSDPVPSPETFTDESAVKSPFRSKVKISHYKKPVHKGDANDFGTFHDDIQADDPEVDENYQEPIQHDQEQEPEKSHIVDMFDDFIEANFDSLDAEKQSDDGEATVEEDEEPVVVKAKPNKPKTQTYDVGEIMNLTVNEKDNLVQPWATDF